ncbi:T9SS type A sorting domain-containing protein [Allomuricauda sp. M10]|uniref:T9SS type A sorting domain-containing protein n=1 Tax=Allomuricauda sp. M10 TaxID=2683292 RepID=UPI001D17D490|nr:T9SS type A sorting domain-containing protein [Muricauda sp. M10]
MLRKNVTLTTTVDIILDTAEFEGSAFYVAAHATGGSAPYNWYINGQLISTTSSSSFSYRYPCSTGSSYVGVVANTACGSRSDQAYYYEDCGSGHRMVVYPNPASSEITISQIQEKKEVYYPSLSSESISQARDIVLTLLDFTGKPVKEMAFNEPTQDVKMDISTLTKGIYFLRIVGNDVDETHTVVIE